MVVIKGWEGERREDGEKMAYGYRVQLNRRNNAYYFKVGSREYFECF
jgi:hypothetical protein